MIFINVFMGLHLILKTPEDGEVNYFFRGQVNRRDAEFSYTTKTLAYPDHFYAQVKAECFTVTSYSYANLSFNKYLCTISSLTTE